MDTFNNAVQRFLLLDEELRDRILNAAMHEFRYGFKKASTDIVVREAGISKGYLFKCFLTKENLYEFLVGYAQDCVAASYFDMINLGQQNILESIWQMAKLKREVTYRYPFIVDFLVGVYTHMDDCPSVQVKTMFIQREDELFTEVYNRCDKTLFRADIDTEKAVRFIWCGLEGVFSGKVTDDYDAYIEKLRGYLDMCRTCFYKAD